MAKREAGIKTQNNLTVEPRNNRPPVKGSP